MGGKAVVMLLVLTLINCGYAFAKIAPYDGMLFPNPAFTETPTVLGLPIMFCKDTEGAYAAFIGSSTCQHFDNIPLEKMGEFIMIYDKEKDAISFLPVKTEVPTKMVLPIIFCKDAGGTYAAFIGSFFDKIPLEKMGKFDVRYNKEKNVVLFFPTKEK